MNQTLEDLRKLDYPVKIEFDAEDAVFTADFPDLPGCSADGTSVEEAYQRALLAKDEWLRVTLEQGLDVPRPSKTLDYSGRLLVRLPTSLHASLADKAHLYQASLNQYIVHLLSGAAVSDTVERRLDELTSYVLGCDRRIGYLTGCLRDLSSQFAVSWGNTPNEVRDDLPSAGYVVANEQRYLGVSAQ